jgi:hypothetical protein
MPGSSLCEIRKSKACRPPGFSEIHEATISIGRKGVVYGAVLADTPTHIVLTGRWSEADFGAGVFVAVLPIKESLAIFAMSAAADRSRRIKLVAGRVYPLARACRFRPCA